jgi:hypothetical protein
MQATVGDRLVIHGKQVGSAERHGEVLEVRGADGAPPYLVRFDDGHEALLYPGSDCELEHVHKHAAH